MNYSQALLVLLVPSLTMSIRATPALAQSRADTIALVRAITAIIVDEASRDGDHRGPFVVEERASSFWGRAVAAQLRNQNADLIAPPGPHALHVALDEVTVVGDTVTATIAWSRCTGRPGTLNYWEHRRTYGLVRSEAGWRRAEPWVVTFADGHC